MSFIPLCAELSTLCGSILHNKKYVNDATDLCSKILGETSDCKGFFSYLKHYLQNKEIPEVVMYIITAYHL